MPVLGFWLVSGMFVLLSSLRLWPMRRQVAYSSLILLYIGAMFAVGRGLRDIPLLISKAFYVIPALVQCYIIYVEFLRMPKRRNPVHVILALAIIGWGLFVVLAGLAFAI